MKRMVTTALAFTLAVGIAYAQNDGKAAGFGAGAYRIGGGVSLPVPIFRPEPEYSEEAHKAKYQGSVILQIVISPKGEPSDVRVVRKLGLGLDEKAMEAVMRWRFKPGMKDGEPVPVIATIEVSFRFRSDSAEPAQANR